MATPQFQFTKAARHAVKLKIGVDGASGSGKTLGALAIAHGIANGGRIAVADSENGSAALYADRFAFDTLNIPDANPATYRAIIDAAVAAQYDALVIDSLSHAWLKVLAEKEDYDRANPKSNSWTNWRTFGPKWEQLMAHILAAPIHIVATMRSKQAYEQVESGGRKSVIKLGLQPQVRDGAEYEFGLVFSVNQAHHAEATKDRTGLFADRLVDLCAPTLHAELVAWMGTGGAAPVAAPKPQLHVEPGGATDPVPQQPAAPRAAAPATTDGRTLEWARALPLPFKGSAAFGTPLGQISIDGLQSLIEWVTGKQADRGPTWHADTVVAMRLVLADLETAQGNLPLGGEEDDDDIPDIGAGSGGPVTMPPGGSVASTLAGQERAGPVRSVSATEPNAIALNKAISKLLAHEKVSPTTRENVRKQLQAPDVSLQQLMEIEARLQGDIDLPF